MSRLPLDWQCPMCGLVNLEGRIYCERCTMPNPYRVSHPSRLRAAVIGRRTARQKVRRDAERHGGWGAGLAYGAGKLRAQLVEEKRRRLQAEYQARLDKRAR